MLNTSEIRNFELHSRNNILNETQEMYDTYYNAEIDTDLHIINRLDGSNAVLDDEFRLEFDQEDSEELKQENLIILELRKLN